MPKLEAGQTFRFTEAMYDDQVYSFQNGRGPYISPAVKDDLVGYTARVREVKHSDCGFKYDIQTPHLRSWWILAEDVDRHLAPNPTIGTLVAVPLD